jgi:hypothetical protein
MRQLTPVEAKTQLADIVKSALEGDVVIITLDDGQKVQLVPVIDNTLFFRSTAGVRNAVRTMAPGVPGIQPTSDSIPSFTEQDVRDQLGNNAPALKIHSEGESTITHIRFTTIGELDRASGDNGQYTANYPAGLPICYVEFSGSFHVWGPPHPERTTPAVSSGTRFSVFDARNGNSLFGGTPAQAKWES